MISREPERTAHLIFNFLLQPAFASRWLRKKDDPSMLPRQVSPTSARCVIFATGLVDNDLRFASPLKRIKEGVLRQTGCEATGKRIRVVGSEEEAARKRHYSSGRFLVR